MFATQIRTDLDKSYQQDMTATPNPQQVACITTVEGEDEQLKTSGIKMGRKMIIKQSYSQALSAKYPHNFYKSTQDNMEEQTEERFLVDSGAGGRNSVPTNSHIEAYNDKVEDVHVEELYTLQGNFPDEPNNSQNLSNSIQVIEQDSEDFTA